MRYADVRDKGSQRLLPSTWISEDDLGGQEICPEKGSVQSTKSEAKGTVEMPRSYRYQECGAPAEENQKQKMEPA